MHSMIRRSIRGLALFSVLAGTMALATTEAHAQGDSNSQAQRINGAWLLAVTEVDCATRVPTGRVFWSALTFAQGGTLTNITTGANPMMRSTGLGTWEKAGDHTFTAVTLAFLFTPTGAWAGSQKIAIELEIGSDPDKLTGTTEVDFFNTSGTLTMTACADVDGSRLD